MKMVQEEAPVLTEDEAALYDRQIRLWGLDAQKRLRGAKVLVAGLCGLGAEITKNLVLAGIKEIVLLDHCQISPADTAATFLAPHDSIGKNRAEASCERAQALNPMVSVTTDTSQLSQKTEDFFKDFEVVCVLGANRRELLRVSEICRKFGVLFYCGDVLGTFGFMFCDLLSHEFVEEVKEKTGVTKGESKKQAVEETKLVKKTENFTPLSQALNVDWTAHPYASRLKRASPGYFALLVLWEFESVHGRRPDGAHREADEAELLTIKHALLEKMAVPNQKLDNAFAKSVYGQVSPVCAVVGGVLSQEVIKSVSKKDCPINNFLFFDIETCAATVECIGQ